MQDPSEAPDNKPEDEKEKMEIGNITPDVEDDDINKRMEKVRAGKRRKIEERKEQERERERMEKEKLEQDRRWREEVMNKHDNVLEMLGTMHEKVAEVHGRLNTMYAPQIVQPPQVQSPHPSVPQPIPHDQSNMVQGYQVPHTPYPQAPLMPQQHQHVSTHSSTPPTHPQDVGFNRRFRF